MVSIYKEFYCFGFAIWGRVGGLWEMERKAPSRFEPTGKRGDGDGTRLDHF